MRLLPALIVVALLHPAPLAAQAAAPQQAPAAPFIGKTVVEVRLETEGLPTDDPAVIDLVATRVGKPLAMADVRESIAHLFGLGRFQDVRVEAVEAPGGVRLLYDMIPIHAVQRIDFSGTLGLSEGLLRRTVVNRFSAAPPVGRVLEVARTLEQLYRDHGYLRPSVRPVATERHDPDRTLLTFEIDAGPRAVVRTVEITGEPLEGRPAFQKAVHAVPAEPYDPTAINDGLADYVAKLKKKRRYEAVASYGVQPSADATSVDLTINLETGPIVTVTFGGDPLPKDKLDELVPAEREGSVDQDLIEDSIQRIKLYLNQLGYWKADAQAERQEANGTLTIAFTVRRGLQYRIADGVELQGNRALPLERLRPVLARLQANEVFVESNLTAAIGAIAGLYQRLGYARAKVNGAPNELNPSPAGQGRVKPTIVITEGPLSVVGDVTFKGDENIPADLLRSVVRVATGQPYYEPQIVADRDAVLLEYRNRGFESADVVVRPLPSADGTRVDALFEINEGPQTVVDHILIVGNTRTDQRVIKRELLLQEGKPLGLEDQIESQRRLSALGLFRRIRIDALSHGTGERKDLLVTVEEAAATTLSYGGGMEVTRRLRATGPAGEAQERLELAPRGFFDIGRRNIGGKNRSVDLYTRLSLRPEDSTQDGTVSGGHFGFSEYRVVGTYREPRVFGVNADLLLTAAVEQGIRTSFNFARKGVNAEVVRRLSPGVRASGRYSFGTTRTFDEKLDPREQADIDRIFPQVRLSGMSGAISRDTRDDVLDPARGMFVSGEGTVAARALGGQVGFMKTYVQAFWFRQLPVKRRAVFASRLALGLADGFPRPAPGETEPIEDLPASERFFAGGDTTIRGFALDSVGAPNTISPTTGFPRGGNAVIVINGELRFGVWKDLGAAVFVDGGNVFNRVTEFDLGELRGATGFGIRYRSPIGPIRVDIGFKMDRRVIGTALEARRALHFSIGQAF
jgi:outer membrane protein assembly complex protein YaeT